jgi:hypothetical protein
MRSDLRRIAKEVLAEQSIDWKALDRTDLGDGFRLVIPATITAAALLDPFIPNLESALREHRKSAATSAMLRLRVVLHHGPVHRDGGEWVGAPMIHCARLLDADGPRKILANLHHANLVLIVSASIFETVVRHGYGLDPRLYQRIAVEEKETVTAAWVHVPGHLPPYPVGPGGSQVSSSGGPEPAPDAPKEGGRSGVTIQGGQTTIYGSVIGGDQWNLHRDA